MMNFKRALDKEQTTCINGMFVVLVFLSHFGQYERMPWNKPILAIGQLMVAPFCSFLDMELWNKSRKKGTSTLITCLEREYLSSTYTSVWHYVFIYCCHSY